MKVKLYLIYIYIYIYKYIFIKTVFCHNTFIDTVFSAEVKKIVFRKCTESVETNSIQKLQYFS